MLNVQSSTFKVQRSRFEDPRPEAWNLAPERRNVESGTPNIEPGTLNPDRGFTIVEMVMTIVIMGILAAVVMPRFIGRGAFDSRAFYDQAQIVVRYAQKTAIAHRGPVYVCITSNSVSAGTVSDCSSLVAHPLTGDPLTATAPSGVTLSPANFSFDGGGRPSPNAQTTITFTSGIPGDPARQIVVEAETGYVHP